jgi:formylglycine-generating enzyme required for sulfatase activity
MKTILVAAAVMVAAAVAFALGEDRPVATPSTTTAPANRMGKELVLDLGNNVTMKLVRIPAGKFTMGNPASEQDGIRVDDSPQHEVTISKAFYMGVTEVTQEQHEAVMGYNLSWYKGAKNPVVFLSWREATEFCEELSKKEGKTFRLPTEAEWEYACRAGTTTRYSFGDKDEELADYAWFDGNSGNRPHPVAQKKPNGWGLYDMHGNAEEWCMDWIGKYPSGAVTDPTGAPNGDYHVVRGGSWSLGPGHCRSASRTYVRFGPGGPILGLRVVLVGVD